jgi:hypothetical protein
MSVRTGLLTIGVLASIATLSANCGGGGGSKPLTEDEFCTQKAGKECNKVVDSCSITSATDCQTARKKVCTDWIAAIKAVPGTPRIFTPANVGACLNKAGAVYAQTLIKPADLADLDDVCNYVFQGNVAKLSGTTCMVNYDCKDRGATICDKGQCADKSVKPLNAQCSDFGAVCQPSQYCTMMGVAMKCVDKIAKGGTCSAAIPCIDTLRCTGGMCEDKLKLNDPCCTDDDCPTTAPYCNPYASYECTNGLSFATHSPSCVPFGDTNATAAVGTPTCPTTGAGGMGGGGGGGGAGGAAGGTPDAGGDASDAGG